MRPTPTAALPLSRNSALLTRAEAAPAPGAPKRARVGVALPLFVVQLMTGGAHVVESAGAAGALMTQARAADEATDARRSPGSAVAGSNFYAAPDGDDAHDGTLEQPWRTIGAAVGRLGAGDTLYLRAGAYAESNIDISGLQGRSGAPITITGYPGERPVLDGALAEFRSAPNRDWEVHDGGRHVYRSVRTYELSGPSMVKGKLEIEGAYHALIAYRSLEALTASIEHVSTEPYYMGPGVFWDPSDRRIYVRLQAPSADAVLRKFDIPPDPDPRRNRLYIWPENTGFRFNGPESAHLVFDGLDYFGLSRVVEIKNASHHLTFANGTSVHQGFVIARAGAHHLLFDNLELHANIPEYLAWKDLKCVAVGQPAKETRYAQFAFGDRGAHHVEVRHSTVHRAFDGAVVKGAGSHDIRFHNNTFYVIDDTVQLGSASYNIEVGHNRIIGAGVSHDGDGVSPARPGTKYIHHNIIDQRQEVLWNRQDPEQLCDKVQGFVVLKVFPSHRSDGFGQGDPWKIYQNTMVYSTTGSGDPGFVQQDENDTGVLHEVYNNIIDNWGERWIYRGPRVDDGSQVYDGNAMFRHAASTSPLLLDVRHGVREQDFVSLGDFRSSEFFAATRSYYGPGWEANGIEANPALDDDYRPTAGAVLNGGVDLSAKPWPGVDARVYRGAIAPGTDGSGIGDPDRPASSPPGPSPTIAAADGGGEVSLAGPAARRVSARIASGADDAEEVAANGRIRLNSSDLELADDRGAAQLVGLRFTNLEIPPGAGIAHAHLRFTVDEGSAGATSVRIWAQASGDAPAFGPADFDISARPRTGASVGWEVPAWAIPREAGAAQLSPDLAPVIQEVVDGPGWRSGNALVLVIEGRGDRVAEAADGALPRAPALEIELGPRPAPVALSTAAKAAPGEPATSGASVKLTPTVSTWIAESEPAAANGSATRLKVDGDAGDRSIALLRFDLDGVAAGAVIRTATLTLETTDPGDGGRLHRMLGRWSGGDTWSSLGDGIQADGSQARAAPDRDTGPIGELGPVRLDVAAAVQAWIDGEPNHGWAFLPNGKDGWHFRSKDSARPPVLEIVFE